MSTSQEEFILSEREPIVIELIEDSQLGGPSAKPTDEQEEETWQRLGRRSEQWYSDHKHDWWQLGRPPPPGSEQWYSDQRILNSTDWKRNWQIGISHRNWEDPIDNSQPGRLPFAREPIIEPIEGEHYKRLRKYYDSIYFENLSCCIL